MCHFTLISHDFFLNVHVSPCKWCKAKLSGVVILVAEMGTVAHEPLVTMLSLFQIKCLHTCRCVIILLVIQLSMYLVHNSDL